MDGLARASGAGVPIELEGKTFIIEPLTVKDWGVIEQHLLSIQPNPVKVVGEAYKYLPPEKADELLNRAYRDATEKNTVSEAAVQAWLETLPGRLFAVWLSFRKHQPHLSVDDIAELFARVGEAKQEEIAAKLAQASGTDELGNSTGQGATATTPTKTTATQPLGDVVTAP